MKKISNKSNILKIGSLIFGTLLMTVVSCSKEEETAEELSSTEVISTTELQFSDEAEMISEEITTITEDV